MNTYQINNLIHMHITRKKSIHSNNKKTRGTHLMITCPDMRKQY